MAMMGMTDDMLKRSITDLGDPSRLRRVFEKAERGEPITLGVIGGSITQWVMASAPQFRYANRVAEWLQARFPRSDIRLINAGRGATGSNYAALRAHRDLFVQQPDLVILEFAVNDGTEVSFGETLEGLLRQTLQQPQQPAVVMLFMMRRNGGNAQERLSSVGTHYHIPMTSYRDALWPEIDAGRMTWEEISPDEVHPNDLGHAHAAACVTHLFERTLEQEVNATPTPFPKPLYSDAFESTQLLEATSLVPVQSRGWWLDSHGEPWPCWVSQKPGSSITFEVAGQTILLMFFRKNGAFGRAAVQVDNRPETLHDAWFDQTWGGYRETVVIAAGLPHVRHRVRIRLLDQRNPNSSGDEFRILGLGTAGRG